MCARIRCAAYSRNLGLASLCVQYQLCPLLESRPTLLEVIMAIVGAFDTTQLVTQAPFGHFAPHAQRCQVRARRASQIVEREVR